MKKILCMITMILLIGTTGCIKRDNLEYITERLYKDHSTIYSIYPNEVDIASYELTEKQIKDYSKGNMYIFNGFSKEKDYVAQMFEHNKNLMIVDTTLSMEKTEHQEELWLDPSNFLMLALNIKNGLLEYISNHYLAEEIESNYENLKIEISNLDAKIKLRLKTKMKELFKENYQKYGKLNTDFDSFDFLFSLLYYTNK